MRLPEGKQATAVEESNGVLKAVLACKWTLAIVELLLKGTYRTADLRRSVPGITPKILHDRLDKLERLGMVRRRAYAGYPLRVEYSATPQAAMIRRVLAVSRAAGLDTESLTVIAKCKWTLGILRELQKGPHRASELKRTLHGISNKMLFQRLTKLERLGLVERRVHTQRPVRVEYAPTLAAQKLESLVLALLPTASGGVGQSEA